MEIQQEEYDTIKALSVALNARMDNFEQHQRETGEYIKALIETLAAQEPIIIPAPRVEVKAADVTMPAMPTPVVQVMEAPETPDQLKVYNIIRNAQGVMIRIEEAWK